MKNLKISINKHKAVLSFNKINCKQFESLKWKLIEQNINEISEALSISIEKNNSEALSNEGEENV